MKRQKVRRITEVEFDPGHPHHRICKNPWCGAPYFVAGSKSRLFCSNDCHDQYHNDRKAKDRSNPPVREVINRKNDAALHRLYSSWQRRVTGEVLISHGFKHGYVLETTTTEDGRGAYYYNRYLIARNNDGTFEIEKIQEDEND